MPKLLRFSYLRLWFKLRFRGFLFSLDPSLTRFSLPFTSLTSVSFFFILVHFQAKKLLERFEIAFAPVTHFEEFFLFWQRLSNAISIWEEYIFIYLREALHSPRLPGQKNFEKFLQILKANFFIINEDIMNYRYSNS